MGTVINPVICAGISGLLLGTGIGIGFGALIFDCYRNGRVGGGIWFGRKKRSVSEDDENEDFEDDENSIIQSLKSAQRKYG